MYREWYIKTFYYDIFLSCILFEHKVDGVTPVSGCLRRLQVSSPYVGEPLLRRWGPAQTQNEARPKVLGT